ncbi:hypothetical protein P7K49_005476, partial [Saguinus oedipus]
FSFGCLEPAAGCRRLAPTTLCGPRRLLGGVVPTLRTAFAEGEGGAAGGPGGLAARVGAIAAYASAASTVASSARAVRCCAGRARRGRRAAMEPDSVIEDKTIELMVSAAHWTVCASVRPAPDWPAHLNVRCEAGSGSCPRSRPRPGPLAFSGLGPGRSWPGPLHAPRSLLPLPLSRLRSQLSDDPRSFLL